MTKLHPVTAEHLAMLRRVEAGEAGWTPENGGHYLLNDDWAKVSEAALLRALDHGELAERLPFDDRIGASRSRLLQPTGYGFEVLDRAEMNQS